MSTQTNSTLSSVPLSLDELSRLMNEHRTVPVGFIVSQEAFDAILLACVDRFQARSETFAGIKIVIDPTMPATGFEAVFTQEAWRKRLAEIQN